MNEKEISEIVSDNLRRHINVCRTMSKLNMKITECAVVLCDALKRGGRVFFCGNGGSAADAQHLAAELSGRYLFDRVPLDAQALHCNTSALTAIANDFGYDDVFARQIRAHGRACDVLVAISTSGNSTNIVKAVEAASKKGIRTVALTGGRECALSRMADIVIAVPSIETPRVQEMHILIGHTLCEIVEKELCTAAENK